MASVVGSGSSLGAAVHDLLQVSPVAQRTVQQQLQYLTADKTGASLPSVARQLGTTQGNVRIWISGKRKPNAANRARIAQLFERFWGINHRYNAAGQSPGDRPLRVKGPVYINGKKRTSVIVEKGKRARDWNTLRTSTTAEISADRGALFISALDIPIPYLEFRSGHYRITFNT